MLRFFRKMRQALIPENRFGRYFFYAVGEIVLVVIGILIALQINNRNQSNSENKIAEDYIKSMVIELNSDLNYYKLHKSRNLSQITQIDEIQNALNSVGNNLYFRQLMLTTRSRNLDELVNSTQELIDVLNQK